MPPEMSKREALEMMARCKEEILLLRSRIDRLQPKADAYDNIAAVLRLLPQPSAGQGEDFVWRLNKRIQELQSEPAPVRTDGEEEDLT